MATSPHRLGHLQLLAGTLLTLLLAAFRDVGLCLHSPATLAAEHLFLRKQLDREWHVKPRRTTQATATRIVLVWLARCFDWRQALTVVQPATLIRWHRQGFRLCWWWTYRSGQLTISADLQVLICWMARDNPLWGEERIANEFLLKLGLRVSPRTVRKYLPRRLNPGWSSCVTSQHWRTFVQNHA